MNRKDIHTMPVDDIKEALEVHGVKPEVYQGDTEAQMRAGLMRLVFFDCTKEV